MKLEINKLEDLKYFSKAYKEGKIKLNISRITRELKCDRKTVRKALKNEVNKKRKKRKSYLDDYYEIIKNLLNDKNKEFEYINHLYKYLKREYELSCSYSAFRRYIKDNEKLNKKYKTKKDNTFTERFETGPGVQVQFDLKEKVKIIDTYNNIYKVYIPTLTLGYSRYNIRRITLDNSYESVISFLAEAFEEIGGTPEEIVIDNIKCLVDTPRTKNTEAILNVKFAEFLKDYNIKCKPCMPYRPKTKEKTETQNKIPGQLKNYNGDYTDLSDIHNKLKMINEEDNNDISQATGFPRKFIFAKEKDNFATLPSESIRSKYYLTLDEVIVSNESLISYKSNKYSVPKKYIGSKVNRIIKNNKLHLYYNNKIITVHEISDKKINIKEEHELNYEKEKNIIITEMENIKYD